MSKLSSKGSLKVLNGPFEGMKYIPFFNGEYFTQKVLGYYEYVLSGTIGKVCDTGYGTIIDVGAAEGYYACGLAVRLPSARVVCFEADGAKHEAIRRIAALNGVDGRIDIRGFCDVETFKLAIASAEGRSFALLDCEGGEDQLLCNSVELLKRCDILVETHEFIVPGVVERLISKFSETHQVFHFEPASPPPSILELADQLGIDHGVILNAADELRPSGNGWLWMVSNYIVQAVD